MFKIMMLRLNRNYTVVQVCRRHVSQFLIPKSDCSPNTPVRRVIDPRKCSIKGNGLVLGIYHNEHIQAGEPTVLTASAQQYDRITGGKLWRQLKLTPPPKLGDYRIFYDLDPQFQYVAVAGLGSECLTINCLENMNEAREAVRIAAATGARALQKFSPENIHVESFGDAEAAAEGANLGIWTFTEYKRPVFSKNIPRATLSLYDDCDAYGWKFGMLKSEAQNLVRYLQEMPANLLNPTEFAKIAVTLLCELDINVEVQTQGWAAAHDMGAFAAIGASSIQPPLYVELSYYGADELTRPIVLIGKGVTFDSGGLDLKPHHELRHMRGDMAGAACVIAATRAAALLKMPINIRGILPLCEVMPSGNSAKYGDVVCSASGNTIRMRLPSREGRLLIADSLTYARNYWPKFIVDVGTMSRELMDTLGAAACACYSNSEELYCYMENASMSSGDRVWRMPLWKFYEQRVRETQTADIANTAKYAPYGDSPNCAAFLRQFICDSAWVHLDTYNVAYTKGFDFPYLTRGMTGRPTRTIIEFLCQLIADSKL